MPHPDLRRHKLGWIGTGRMGFPMAARLLKKGCDVAIYNRTRAKAEPLAPAGGRLVDSPAALPYLESLGQGVSYVGEGELARIVKICHNVFLGVVTQSLAEITVLAEKAGAPRHAFLDFINKSVMGSTFTRYKTPAFVNLDFTPTFTPVLLRKDLDLGLDAGRRFEVPMPLASITRDLVQTLIGRGMTEEDFAQLLLLQAEASGVQLQPENVPVDDGLGG